MDVGLEYVDSTPIRVVAGTPMGVWLKYVAVTLMGIMLNYVDGTPMGVLSRISQPIGKRL